MSEAKEEYHMNEQVRILCVDDETNVLRALERLFFDEEYEVLTAVSGEAGLEVLANNQPIQVVISDYRMPGMNGVDFLRDVCGRWPETVRIVLSGYADTAAVVSAINEGQIYKFIPKPWNDDELKITIAKAIEVYFLHKKNLALTRELQTSNEELHLLNENLERLVEERTAALLFQNKVLTGAHTILDSLTIGVLGLDNTGVIVQCNERAAGLVAPKGGSLLGMPGEEVLPEALLTVLATKKALVRTRLMLADQSIRIEESVMAGPDGQNGRILVFIPETSES